MIRVELTVALVLVIAMAAPVALATATTATTATPAEATAPAALDGAATVAATNTTCTTVVQHDAFRDDNETVAALAESGSATATTQNTRVAITEDSGFYRVQMDNPNGYCVTLRVFVAARAMEPASLPGTVESTNGTTTATWEAVHDWNTSTTYTRIEATVPASTSVQFAPSAMRVKSLAWTSQQTSAAEGVLRRVKTGVFGEPTVTKRHYNLTADEGDVPVTYTVRLRDPHSGAELEEYHALYTTDGETWTPVGTDTEAPVYLEEAQDGSAVRFTFTEPARVRFTANPSPIDDAQRQWRSYDSGIDQIVEGLLSGFGLGDEEEEGS